MTLGTGGAIEPNAKATIVEAANGLVVKSQNAWPSLKRDFGAVNSWFAPFIGAGFYYKTFIGPVRGAWMLYEPFIRRAAGLGKASFEPDPDRYETRATLFCDVLVVGGGPGRALGGARGGQGRRARHPLRRRRRCSAARSTLRTRSARRARATGSSARPRR